MLKSKTYKLKAGALQLVMYVIIVIGVLLSMFILYFHLNTKLIAQHNSQLEAISLADEGMRRSLELDFDYGDSLELANNDYSKTVLRKSHWGIYDVVTSTSTVRDKSFQKVGLVGGKTPLNPNLALYLQDNQQALQVVGNTKITGDAYVGEYGIRPGMISGLSYTNNQLVYGKSFNSGFLPKLEFTKEKYLKKLISRGVDEMGEVIPFDLNLTSSIRNSFNEPPQFFYSTQAISLFSKALYGNIIIQSDEQIYVNESSDLENVILIAPKITIGANFTGSLQAVASQELIVEEKVHLNYPSALLLIPSSEIDIQKLPRLQVNSNSKVKGSIAYLKSNSPALDQNTFSHLSIEESASIYGQVYSAYNLELMGNVFGHVIANQFITPLKGSIYINHLYNAQITADPVSADFGGLIFNEKQIVSWVD